MLKRLFLSLALMPLAVLPAAPARADNGPELWYQVESRVTFPGDVGLRPKAFRVIAVNFWGERFPGLGQALMRFSPVWEPHPNVSLALNFAPGMEQTSGGLMNQQFRIEAEPSLRWSLGAVAFNNRTRLEHRWAQQGNLWRVRNQLRLSLPRLEWDWIPFVSEEAFYDLTAQSYNQNRASIGISHSFWEGVRLDVAYVLRHRLTDSGWDRDHALSLALAINHKDQGESPTQVDEPSP